MIGNLLKQLAQGLGRFIWYHTTRIFARRADSAPSVPPSRSAQSAQPASTVTPASIAALSNEIGLDPGYKRLVSWPSYRRGAPNADMRADDLYQLWTTIPGGHKWSHYFAVYQEVFGARRAEPLRVLEIGVFQGASLQLWKRYFTHPQTIIVGIDVTPQCMQFDAPGEGIRVRIGSQTDAAFLKGVVEEFGPFDLIVDDGSHHSSHIITSFNHLFSDGLKDSGVYFVEDLHANYWFPWRDSRRSFLDLCKELLEHMHAHYLAAPPGAFMVADEQPMLALEVPRITTMIREMRFFDSIAVIYKTHRDYIPYYVRMEM